MEIKCFKTAINWPSQIKRGLLCVQLSRNIEQLELPRRMVDLQGPSYL